MKKQANIGRLPDQMNANVSDGQRPAPAARLAVAAAAHRAGPAVDARGPARADEAGRRRRRHDVERRRRRSRRRRRRINDLQRQLRQYQAAGYTDQHPDIIADEGGTDGGPARAARSAGSRARRNSAELLAADATYRQKVQRARRRAAAHRHPAAADHAGAGADRLLSDARRVRAAGRTGALVAACRTTTLERTRYRGPDARSTRRRRSPRTSRASRAASASSC